MKIVVDALASRYGGSAHAIIETAPRLAAAPGVDGVVVVTRADSIIAEGLTLAPGLTVVRLGEPHVAELPRRLAWEAVRLPSLICEHDASVVLTWSGMLPRRLPVPVVSYLANPILFTGRGLPNAVRRAVARRTSQAAASVLVPSEGMREVAAPAIGRSPEIVPLGVDHGRFSPAPERGRELLCVADFYAHKRHDVLFEAWRRLPEPRPALRLVGNPDVDPAVYRAVMGLRPAGVVVESRLSLPALVDRYRRAAVVVIPSDIESFCIPVLEALACGIPVVVRDLPSLRETGGDAARYVSGDDPSDWVLAISAAMAESDPVPRAVEHARTFSWDRMVGELRDRLAAAAAR
jgi:glycosyltransferase involved in cell wall biosynthesis